MTGLSPAFESKPQMVEGIDPIAVEGRRGLFLLPGHLRLSEYETTLSMAHEFAAALMPLKNVPGSINFLFHKTAERVGADIILVDMNPSLSAMNQNILMTSGFFLIPTSPDYFSVMALNSLAAVLPRWAAWYKQALQHPILKQSVYPLPNTTPKLLGTIIQNYRPRDNRPTAAFRPWIAKIEETVLNQMFGALEPWGMVLPKTQYGAPLLNTGLTLAQIPNFNGLVAASQEKRKPVFTLTKADVNQQGNVWDTTSNNIDTFHEKYAELAQVVIGLTKI